MVLPKGFAAATVLLISVVVFPEQSHCRNISHVTTTCGQEVPITNADDEHLMVNLTFSQPQSIGAVCSWLIPARNDSMSNQIILTDIANQDALSCDKNVFSMSEKNPLSGALNPLTLECLDSIVNVSRYIPVVGQPGFPIVVSLNTTSALSENFVFMHVLPFVWTDEVCPRTERKVIIVQPGDEDDSETLSLVQVGRFPDNLLCKWEFRSPDEGIVHFEIISHLYDWKSSSACGGGDHFVVTDGNKTGRSVIVPLCKDPGVRFKYTSTSGSIFVNMVSDSSGGAYSSFYFKYWSVQSCPSTQLAFMAYVGKKYRFKGSSFSPQGAGQERQCWWQIVTNTHNVIKLYRLEAEEFQQNCDDSKDYLMVNSRKVSFCSGDMFPIWSEDKTMRIVFHTDTELQRRSFLLHFTAVFKSPCQGYPQRKTVVGSRYSGDHVVLMPIPQGDIGNGLLCQWIFTAKDAGNAVRVSVDWAETGSDTERRGVPFDKETCSFPNFRVYDSDIAENSSAEITPTCSADKSTIIYTSSSRSVLFMYRRESGVAESGFAMEVNQVRDTTNDGGSTFLGRDVSFLGWRIVALAGLVLLFVG